ncbi:MAG: hypothetical protein RJA25_106 [Bacteroidota bacterium]
MKTRPKNQEKNYSGFSSQKSLEKENEMILLYTVLGVLSVMFSVLAFGSRKNLLEGGWDEEMIDEVKKFFHTNNFKNNQKSVK